MKKQEQGGAGAFAEAVDAWIGACRTLAEQGVRTAVEGLEAAGKEAAAMLDASSSASRAKTPEEAARAAADYFGCLAVRTTEHVRAAAEVMPKRFAETAVSVGAAMTAAFKAFQSR